MTIDDIISILAFSASAIAIYFSTRKQNKEGLKADADTISSLFETVRNLEKENKDIRKEFADYKRETNAQLGELASEIVRYRRWAKHLVRQLETAGITPTKFEDV